jgi:N-acetylglucosaminyldiphosphoundecaprenol N-acetyl-beta-D-mannosaminyltransferase
MIDRGKHRILGIPISAVDYETAVERITTAAKQRRSLTVSALAVHAVMTGAMDPVHRYRLNQFDLLVPDGQPVRWALNRFHGTGLRQRVYGPTLMLETCRRAAAEKLPIFLFGNPDVLDELQMRLRERFAGLEIAGAHAAKYSRVSADERRELLAAIRASGAAITFVGLGCPRQDIWTFECHRQLSMPVISVGAAFDMHAGRVPQAPRFMQDRGLEWLFRLLHEPRRLWRRYLVTSPMFVSMLALERLGLRRFDGAEMRAPAEEVLVG